MGILGTSGFVSLINQCFAHTYARGSGGLSARVSALPEKTTGLV